MTSIAPFLLHGVWILGSYQEISYILLIFPYQVGNRVQCYNAASWILYFWYQQSR